MAMMINAYLERDHSPLALLVDPCSIDRPRSTTNVAYQTLPRLLLTSQYSQWALIYVIHIFLSVDTCTRFVFYHIHVADSRSVQIL